jgi:hypothetical protein
MRKYLLISLAIGALGVLGFASPALADYTVVAGHNCSVTADTPATTPNAGYLSYYESASCAGSDGRVSKSLVICAMVDFGGTWVNVPGDCYSATNYANPNYVYFTAPCAPGAVYATDVSSYALHGGNWYDRGSFASWQNFSVRTCP